MNHILWVQLLLQFAPVLDEFQRSTYQTNSDVRMLEDHTSAQATKVLLLEHAILQDLSRPDDLPSVLRIMCHCLRSALQRRMSVKPTFTGTVVSPFFDGLSVSAAPLREH